MIRRLRINCCRRQLKQLNLISIKMVSDSLEGGQINRDAGSEAGNAVTTKLTTKGAPKVPLTVAAGIAPVPGPGNIAAGANARTTDVPWVD